MRRKCSILDILNGVKDMRSSESLRDKEKEWASKSSTRERSLAIREYVEHLTIAAELRVGGSLPWSESQLKKTCWL